MNDFLDTTEFENRTIKDVQLTESTINSKHFDECIFENCDFSNTTFKECVFFNCKFRNCNLSLVKLPESRFNNVSFFKCKMIGINWTIVSWRKNNSKKKDSFPIRFKECVMNYSVFIGLDLIGINLLKCVLKDAYFEESDMREAIVSDTDFMGAVFSNTNLTKADFSQAINYTIDACSNNIKKAKFSFPEAMALVYAMDIEII